MDGRLILFPAIYKDGELLEHDTDYKIDSSSVKIKGELRKKSWDPINWCFRMMFGLFIEYDGHEYGTLDMTEQEFIDLCNGVGFCCQDPLRDRIHVAQFAIEFV